MQRLRGLLRSLPRVLPSTFDEGLGKRQAAFRHFPQAIPANFAIKKLDRAPCVRGCPANLSAQGYVQLIKAGKYPEALSLIMDRLPLPGTIGRICPHPCETDCRAPGSGRAHSHLQPEAVCGRCRGLDDPAGARGARERAETVAIIGAGPSGLSCAYHLALKGYKAVIFEAAAEAGGWLRYGIPAYRLPREVLQREVDYIQRLGVEIRYNTPLGGDTAPSTISSPRTASGPSSWASGPRIPSACRCPGSEAQGVLWGVEYLKEFGLRPEVRFQGKKVTVIGGGNVAMDVARTARRQGGQVTLICPGDPGRDARFALGSGRGRGRRASRSVTAGASNRSWPRTARSAAWNSGPWNGSLTSRAVSLPPIWKIKPQPGIPIW